jgi:hypothetical protein
MSDLKEEFMAAAVKPIGNPEQKLGLWAWLGEMIGKADGRSLEEAIRRWKAVDMGKTNPLVRKVAFVVLTALALFGALMFPNPLRDLKPLARAVGSGGGGANSLQRLIGAGLSADEKLLVGDPTLTALQQKEALFASDPDNPAFFADYAVCYQQTLDRLPPDFLATAHRLDLDNAWFDYFAASVVAKKSVESAKRTKEEREAYAPFRWTVRKPELVRESLELFRRAKGKSRFENYEESLLRQRIRLLPQQNQIEWLASLAYVAGQSAAQMPMKDLSNVISSQAWKAGEDRNLELFRQAEADAIDFLGNMGKLEDLSLIGELIHRASASGFSGALADAASKLGLPEDANRWEAISARFNQDDKERRAKNRGEAYGRIFMEKGGMFVGLTVPLTARQVRNPPQVTDEDLKPARLMDHRLIGAASAFAVWILLALVCLALVIYRFKGPESPRLLAMRGCQLLRTADWVWVLLAGVILPVAAVVSVSWFTPAGGSGHSIKMTMREPLVCLPAAHYLALFLMVIILSVIIARWRLSVSTGVFGFRGISWSGLAVVAGLVFYVVGYLYVHWLVGIALYAAVLWLLVMLGFGLFGRRTGLLRRLMIGRMILPAYLLGMVCMTAVSAASMASYREWFRKDEFMKFTAEAPAMIPYEYKVAKQLREEIDAMLQID